MKYDAPWCRFTPLNPDQKSRFRMHLCSRMKLVVKLIMMLMIISECVVIVLICSAVFGPEAVFPLL